MEQPENPATRVEAMARIEELLRGATESGRRLLCGFDFPFGYPTGTARVLTGQDSWEAVWARIADVIEDGPRNSNNRFWAAALLNSDFVGEGPFWGHPPTWDVPGLLRKRPLGWGQDLPPEIRYAECGVKGTQPVWKLWGNGSVGSQALTGIAALQGLRHRVNAQVWPFETLGEGEAHVLVEIFPSLVEPAPGPAVTDARQVSTMAAAMEQLDKHGALAAHLSAPTSMPAMVCREEGTILGMQDSTELQEAAR